MKAIINLYSVEKNEITKFLKEFYGTKNLKVKNIIISKQGENSENLKKLVEITQSKKTNIILVEKGDVVKIPPNAVHWHGAAPDSEFAHISIEPNLPGNTTTWLEPVSDKEYR